MILFYARHGSLFAGWFDTEPPRIDVTTQTKKIPKFRVPDVYHDRVVGSNEAVIADFQRVGILPAKFTPEPVQQEWAAAGIQKAADSKRRKRTPRPDPEVSGLFPAADVAKTVAK